MDIVLHPDLGLFPAGTTVKAYERSVLGIGGNFPSGPPSGTAADTAVIQADGSLTFTGLTALATYYAHALVDTQDRYFGFIPGASGAAPESKFTYDPATDTVNVEAANFTIDGAFSAIPASLIDAKGDLIVGSAADTAIRKGVGTDGQVLTADSGADGGVGWATPSAGGSSAPTDVLLLGTDVALINGWTAPAPGDFEPVGRIYKQGGRVYLFGSIIAPGSSGSPFVAPAGYLPYDFGDAAGADLGFAITSNWSAACFAEVLAAGALNIAPAPSAGVFIQLDGISWPLAPA